MMLSRVGSEATMDLLPLEKWLVDQPTGHWHSSARPAAHSPSDHDLAHPHITLAWPWDVERKTPKNPNCQNPNWNWVSPPHCHLDPVHAQPRVSAQSKKHSPHRNMVGAHTHFWQQLPSGRSLISLPSRGQTPVLVRKPSSGLPAGKWPALIRTVWPWKMGRAHLAELLAARALLNLDVPQLYGKGCPRLEKMCGGALACWR